MASGSEQYRILLDTSQLGEGVNRGTREFDRLGVSAEDAGARIDSAMKKAGAAAASYFTAQYLKQFTADIVKTRAEIESYEVSFRTLLGDERLSKKFFGEIREFAVQTPLYLNTLANGAQMMLGFNIEAEKVIPTLKQIGDISMGDAQRFQSLTLAFSQMSATGKLMGQDLLQMINAGFNPLTEISRKTGKSISELKDEMSAGAISADMVADAFKSATDEGGKFHGMLEQQSKSMQGSISNLVGAIDDMKNAMGEGMQPVDHGGHQRAHHPGQALRGGGQGNTCPCISRRHVQGHRHFRTPAGFRPLALCPHHSHQGINSRAGCIQRRGEGEPVRVACFCSRERGHGHVGVP